ncbi:MAG: Uma2 family endonuclease [Planctomycetota bacterium]|nr:Uma2 family endonuclease [Planctomycetota bacterium]
MGTTATRKTLTREEWPAQGRWTYADWLRLPDDGYRYEVLKGELFMSPPPTLTHQWVVRELFVRLCEHARHNDLGEVFTAPVGVKIPGQSVPLQPDLLFVRKSRTRILKDDYIDGAPDLIVEVLSPRNWDYDRNEKYRAYEAGGVKEYWIVDYRAKTVEVFELMRGGYELLAKFRAHQTASSKVLRNFAVKVSAIFAG